MWVMGLCAISLITTESYETHMGRTFTVFAGNILAALQETALRLWRTVTSYHYSRCRGCIAHWFQQHIITTEFCRALLYGLSPEVLQDTMIYFATKVHSNHAPHNHNSLFVCFMWRLCSYTKCFEFITLIMSKRDRSRKLTQAELEYLANHLSEVSSLSEHDSDSDDDPDYNDEDERTYYDEEAYTESSDQDVGSDENSDGQHGEVEQVNANETYDSDTTPETSFWSEVVIGFARFDFIGATGSLIPEIQHMLPIDIFKLFIDQEIIDLMVRETNRYAIEMKDNKRLVRSARISRWYDTNEEEMRTFIGKHW